MFKSFLSAVAVFTVAHGVEVESVGGGLGFGLGGYEYSKKPSKSIGYDVKGLGYGAGLGGSLGLGISGNAYTNNYQRRDLGKSYGKGLGLGLGLGGYGSYGSYNQKGLGGFGLNKGIGGLNQNIPNIGGFSQATQ